MKLAGHTHGVQGICSDVLAMVDKIAELGFQGLELAARERVFTVESSRQEHERLRKHIEQSGLEPVNIACYAGEGAEGLNAADQAVRELAERGIEAHLRLARDLGFPCVRTFPGGAPNCDGVVADAQRAFDLSVSGLQRVANLADDLGVTMLIENHPASIACSAGETVKLVEAVDRPNVCILYEPSNLLVFAGEEDHRRGFELQKRWIRHTHIKDQVRNADGSYATTVPGRGILPWADIFGWLGDMGHPSFLSFEAAWTDDLARREEELKEGIAFMRR